MPPFQFAFEHILDFFLMCWIMKINNYCQGTSIQYNSNWILIQIKLIVPSGVQLNLISIQLKSMEIQLIGIALY